MQKLLLIAALLFSHTCFGKEFPSKNFTQADGLPSNTIYDIYEDSDGYMWFATNNGVSKFNGLKFTNYTTADGLPDNECFFFRKDLFGRLWIGTFNGELVYYQNNAFHNSKNTAFLSVPYKGGNTMNIVVEKDSSLIIQFNSREFFISVYKNKIKCYNIKEITHNANPEYLVDIVKENSNSFELLFQTKKIRIDSFSKIISTTKYDPEITKSGGLKRQIIDNSQKFYITGSTILSKELKSLRQTPLNGKIYTDAINRIRTIQGHYFICTNNNMYIDDEVSFKNFNVLTIYVDKDSNFWVGTSGNGVFKLQKEFLNTLKISDAYKSTTIFAQKKGDNLVFVTRDKGAHILNNNRISFNYNIPNDQNPKAIEVNSGQLIYDDNLLNISIRNPYLIKNLSVKPVVHLLPPHAFDNTNKIFYLKGHLYTQGRIRIRHIRNKNVLTNQQSSLILSTVFPDSINVKDKVYGSYSDKDSNLWFSTIDSIYKISDTRLLRQKHLGQLSFKDFIIFGNKMIGCTFDNRLLVVNNFADKNFSIDSSFQNNCLWDKFYLLNDTSIIITTNDYYRILAFSENKTRYKIGIVENESIPLLAEYLHSDKTNCYFFKEHSISKIPVDEIFQKDPAPKLKFEVLRTNKIVCRLDSFISLSFANSRNINITFSVFSFYTNNIRLEYAIGTDENNSEKWIPANSQSINLLRMEPGTYFIKIKAITYAGSESAVRKIKLIIEKPFWLKWWFFLIILSLLALLVLLIIIYYTRKKISQKQKEIKFIKSEYRALNALMNPHFIFNSLNNVQGLINRDDKRSASEYVRTISDLIRQNMYNISHDFIGLDAELDLVKNYLKLEKLRFKDRLTYSIEIDEDVDIDLILIPPLLIQPLVENALKYGILKEQNKEGFIAVKLYQSGDLIVIDVIDNGPGLAKDKNNSTHQSTAIKNINQRLEYLSALHSRKITLEITEIIASDGTINGVKSSVIIFPKIE
jgi:sensor histidine kinase YesM